MHQMVRDEEGVQRTVPHLVETEVVLLLRVGMLGQAIHLGQRCADDVVDDTAQTPEFVDVV